MTTVQNGAQPGPQAEDTGGDAPEAPRSAFADYLGGIFVGGVASLWVLGPVLIIDLLWVEGRGSTWMYLVIPASAMVGMAFLGLLDLPAPTGRPLPLPRTREILGLIFGGVGITLILIVPLVAAVAGLRSAEPPSPHPDVAGVPVPKPSARATPDRPDTPSARSPRARDAQPAPDTPPTPPTRQPKTT